MMASNGATVELRHVEGSSHINSHIKLPASDNIRNVTPSPGPPADDSIVGSWLCDDEGDYQKYIEALSKSNAGLKKADPNNKDGPLKRGNALVVLLDAPASGKPDFSEAPKEFVHSAELRSFLKASGHGHNRRRIYIMEGLAPDYVSAIGGHFFMNPTFFQRQERTCVWSNDFTPVSDALPQPSLLDPNESFHLQYCELRQFNKAIQNRYYFCERTRRHVGMTAPRHSEETTVGILRRKVSWWCRETGNGGWDVVILCDPQLLHLSPHPKEVVPGENTLRDFKNPREELQNIPFQEGYADFTPTMTYKEALKAESHPHKSMLRDLVYYYQNYSKLLADDEWVAPQPSAIFLKKIVAAHYLQLTDYIKVMLPSLELKLTTAWIEEQDQWKSLQTISRRCGNYRDDLEDTLLSLGYPVSANLESLADSKYKNWKDDQKDFQYAYFRLKILKERADNLTTSMVGLASIAGNRQNLEEAKRLKRLNLLALLFIPLAYTSSLFSMQDPYSPNGRQFWIYWVSAVGAVGATFVVTYLLDRALDDEANWTWTPIRWLFKRVKFWGRDTKSPQMKRKSTGLYDLVRR